MTIHTHKIKIEKWLTDMSDGPNSTVVRWYTGTLNGAKISARYHARLLFGGNFFTIDITPDSLFPYVVHQWHPHDNFWHSEDLRDL